MGIIVLENITHLDLKAIVSVLVGKFQQIETIHLFGSRRYASGSTRSDIDVILTLSAHLRPAALRDFAIKHCPSLDFFILENRKAISVVNESFVTSDNNESLIASLNAELLYDRDGGISEFLNNLAYIEIDNRVTNRPFTSLPNTSLEEAYEVHALLKYFTKASGNGLPTKPYLGVNSDEASDFVIEIIRRLPAANDSVTSYGKARNGWTVSLQSEYDLQNLFWITVKPWLPSLAREEVAIVYDGQEKRSDFSLFNSQLIIEFKHIKNDTDKRSIVKTFKRASRFLYST